MITAESITLKDDRGNWLGQIIITNDGMFASVTDYGNFSYAWRAYGDNFKDFLISINTDYFATKMVTGFAYICLNKTIEKGAKLFAEKILPALQNYLRAERNGG
jgi:hypothetical protein